VVAGEEKTGGKRFHFPAGVAASHLGVMGERE
jgi:hypothetical protein